MPSETEPTYIIRKYQASDHDAVCKLFVAGMNEHYVEKKSDANDLYLTQSLQGDLANIEKVYDLLMDENLPFIGCFWVAEQDGSILGMVGVQSLKNQASVAELRRLSVSKTARRLGVGRNLVQVLENWCFSHRFHRIVLTTGEIMQAARRFYESLGYLCFQRDVYRFDIEHDGELKVSLHSREPVGSAKPHLLESQFAILHYQKNIVQ